MFRMIPLRQSVILQLTPHPLITRRSNNNTQHQLPPPTFSGTVNISRLESTVQQIDTLGRNKIDKTTKVNYPSKRARVSLMGHMHP